MKNTAIKIGKDRDNTVIPGISTACFYPQYTELTLRQLGDLSIASTEIFMNCIYELDMKYCKELGKIAEGSGTKILSIHPYTSGMEPMYFFSDYDRRFQEGLELYRRYFAAANALGAHLLVFHGGFRNVQLSYQEYFERYGVLLEEARKYGVELCHENVSRCLSYSPEFFVSMKQYLPDAGCVLDIKQTIRAGGQVNEYVAAMGKNIKHIHISDHTENLDCLPLGKGTFNIHDFLIGMHKNEYHGGVIVELYRENFDTIVEIAESYQLLCGYMSTEQNNC